MKILSFVFCVCKSLKQNYNLSRGETCVNRIRGYSSSCNYVCFGRSERELFIVFTWDIVGIQQDYIKLKSAFKCKRERK